MAPHKEEMIARAQALASKLAQRAEACERARQVPRESVADFFAMEFHRMLQPKRYGGFELGWDALSECAVEFARGCASTAWVFTVYGDHAQLLGSSNPKLQDEIWGADPHALIATSFQPLGKVARVAGGYELSGRWSFSSGIDHASWLLAGAMLDGIQTLFAFPKSQARIVDDWHVAGLSGTGSKSFIVERVFVPLHRAISHADALEGRGPGTKVNAAPVYRFPRRAAGTALGAVAIGAAIGMLDAFCDLARDRARRGRRSSADPVTALKISESASELDCARWLATDSARRHMDVLEAGATPDAALRALVRRNQAYAVTLACRAAERIFAMAGGFALYESSPLQRSFRDVHAAAQHHGVAWEATAQPYGAMRLGREVEMAAL
jgi:3-hydroxy-9,10-secoandrosta-1,3,5(10)-triene-9,17-dione monooxygenase